MPDIQYSYRETDVSVARLLDTAILLLLVTALWAPVGADYEATGLWAYLRYALFGGFSLAIIVLASLQNRKKNGSCPAAGGRTACDFSGPGRHFGGLE